jgi:acyl-CoA thioesterase FadM
MTDKTVYRGLVQRNQADASGLLDAQGASSTLVDAFHIFLALSSPAPVVGVPASAGQVLTPASLQLQRLDGPAPAVGETMRWVLDAQASAEPPGEFQAQLFGAAGPAWSGTVRCQPDPVAGQVWPGGSASLALSDVPDSSADLPAALALLRMKAEHCDQAGHVNVQAFLGLVDEAVGALCQGMAGPRTRLQVVEARVSFKAELFCGDVVSVHSGIRGADRQRLVAVHGIVQHPSGRLVCVVETRLAALDDSGRPRDHDWDAATLRALTIQDWPALPKARPPALPSAAQGPTGVSTLSCMAVVDAWDVDACGWLQMRALVNLCSTGARQYLAQIGLDKARMLAEHMTVAAVDYLVEVQQRPRLGCNLTLRSAHLSASSKSIRFSHHLIDSDLGTVYATVEIVGVMLDLASHRSAEVPADVRLRLNPV